MDAVRSGAGGSRARSAWCLAAIVSVALGVRLWGLDQNTLTHEEVYVPRLVMPEYVTVPPPRATLAETVQGTLHHDNHPPGYYAAMWLWTAVAGTGLFALRLPSALVGAATVAVLFAAIRRREGAFIALTASALLALHGHHVFWSQHARMWVFLAGLAVLSLWLLDSLGRRYRPGVAAAYVAVVTAGLFFEYSFWPFFLAQILWEGFRRCDTLRLPATLELQLLAFAAASPVLAFLVVHLGLDRTGYLARAGIGDHFGGFLLLQWWVRSPPAGEVFGPVESIAVLGFLAAGSVFLITGLVAGGPGRKEDLALTPSPSLPARIAVIGLSTLFSLWLLALGERGFVVIAAVVLPAAILATRPLIARAWPIVSRGLRAIRTNRHAHRLTDDPAGFHTAVPLLLLLLLSLFVPSVASRSLLFLTPFALWAVARGLARLLPGVRARAAAAAILLLAGGISVAQYTRAGSERWDYQALANSMRPFLGPRDVILIHDAWYTQPMHYYFPPDRYRTGDFDAHFSAKPGDRIWLVVLDAKDAEAWAARDVPIRGYAQRRRVGTERGYAVLFTPVAVPSES